jgi:MATE family multidrug resistance protein
MSMPHTPTLPGSPTTRITLEISALWQLAWPILVGQLANVGMAVADVAMAGHASAQDLAGVALGSSIWMIVVVTLMGVMMSVNPTVAHYVGAGEFDRVPHVVRQGLWKGLGVGLVAFVLVNVAALVFDHMEMEPAVHDIATRFVCVASFALPAFACYRVLYGYSASLNQTKPMMAIAIAALLLNCLLNWVLIYGHWGFPKLGGVGCAWATMLCTWFNLAGLLWWMQRSPAYRSTWPFDRFEAASPKGAEPAEVGPADWCDLFCGEQRLQFDRTAGGALWQHPSGGAPDCAEFFVAGVHGAAEPGHCAAEPRRPGAGRGGC